MKKIIFAAILALSVFCFAPQILARGGGDDKGLFEKFYAERQNDPRFAELRQLREQFKEEMRQRPADRNKLRSIYRKMSSLRQAMADDAFEKFLVNLDEREQKREEKREEKRESIKQKRQEKSEERQNSRKEQKKQN